MTINNKGNHSSFSENISTIDIVIIGVYLILFAWAGIGIGIYTNFYVPLNDFWGNLSIAEYIELQNFSSYYNGFFPIGYSLFLRILLTVTDNVIAFAFITNVLFGVALLGSVGYGAVLILGRMWGLMCLVLFSLYPLLFTYILTPGADVGCVTFATLAGVLFIHNALSRQASMNGSLVFLAGILSGFAALWRYHGMVFFFALIISFSFIHKSPLRYAIYCALGFFSIYAFQIFINIASGHGPLETSQNFNIYKLMYKMNWWHIPSNIPSSVGKLIFQHPLKFVSAYVQALDKSVYLAMAPMVAMLLVKNKLKTRLCLSLTLTSLLYTLVVTLGYSVRGVLPLLSFFMISIFLIIKEGIEHISSHPEINDSMRLVVFCVLIVVLGIPVAHWLRDDYANIKRRRARSKVFYSIENIILQEGVKDAKAIFTDHLDLYFKNLPSYVPYKNGGWQRYALFKYNEKYPEVSTEDINAFLMDCQRRKISYIVLSKTADNVLQELGQIYREAIRLNQLRFIASIQDFKIFKIQPSETAPAQN